MNDTELNELKKKVDKMLLPKSKDYQQGRAEMLDEIMNKAFCNFTNCEDCAMWGQYDEFGDEEVCILEQLKLKE